MSTSAIRGHEDMRMNKSIRFLASSLALTLPLAFVALPVQARDVYLRAEAFTVTLPDPVPGNALATRDVSMWGYRNCGTVSFAGCDGATPPPVTSPGPTIVMPDGDSSLTIHVQNRLPGDPASDVLLNATSVFIAALPKAASNPLSPVRFPSGSQFEGRIRSFDTEVAANAERAYTWNIPAGTYLYQSGTQAQVQVQMGLFGTVVKNQSTAGSVAYTGHSFDQDKVVVFSEIDPNLHDAVDPVPPAAAPTYGTTGPTSTEAYAPRYFLINGAPHTQSSAPLLSAAAGDRILLRLVNAGIENHAPQLMGSYFDIVAEDGNVAARTRSQYTTLLPAAKTMDVLFTPSAEGSYALFDRRLRLVNSGQPDGGMLALIDVGGGGPADLLPTANPDSNSAVEGGAAVSGNVLANDNAGNAPATVTGASQGATAITLGSVFATNGGATLLLNANGAYSYTPPAAGSLSAQLVENFDYAMADSDGDPSSSTLNITVDQMAVPDTLYFSTLGNTAVPGVSGPYDDADIYFWNGSAFSRYFDASVAGLAGNANVDSLHVVDADTFYVSFNRNAGTNVPGLGSVDDSDVVRYDAGTWSLYFDGSDVGLTVDDEDVDAFDILADGSVVVSTWRGVTVPGVAAENNEDLLRCVGTFGAATSCTWNLYFDGLDVGLGGGSNDENVVGATVASGNIYLTTFGNFDTGTGIAGQGADVFACNAATTGPSTACASYSMYFDGSVNGITDSLDAIEVPAAP